MITVTLRIDIFPGLLIKTSCYEIGNEVTLVEVYVHDAKLLVEPIAWLYNGQTKDLLQQIEIRDEKIVFRTLGLFCRDYLLEFYSGRIIKLFRGS